MQKFSRKMKSRQFNLLMASMLLAGTSLAGAYKAQAQETPEWKFQEGVHFQRLIPVQGTSSPPDKIEVAEFFWYGCNFCYRMDTYIADWDKRKPDEVNLVHIPAIWDPVMEMHARFFLALQATGVLEEAHRDAFRAIHTEQRQLLTLGDQERFARRHGVSAEDYREAFRSFGVESSLKRVQDLMRRYRILAVPAFVVNGKYVVRVLEDSNMPELLEIVDELVERELSER